MFRKKRHAGPAEAAATATTTAPGRRLVQYDDNEEDEIVITSKRILPPLAASAVSVAAPAPTPTAINPVSTERDVADSYSKERMAELKRENLLVRQAPPDPTVPAADAATFIAQENVVLTGEDAIKLVQSDDEEEEEEYIAPRRTENDEEESGSQVSSNASLPDEYLAEDMAPQLPSSSLAAILNEMHALQHKLRIRRDELEALVSAASTTPAYISESNTTEQRLEQAKRCRHETEDLKLYVTKLVSCLKQKLAILLRSSDYDGRELEIDNLWADVREEFASAKAVVQRFSKWHSRDADEFKKYWAPQSLARLLFPFLVWRIKQLEEAFPFEARFEDWPEIALCCAEFPPSELVFANKLAVSMAALALEVSQAYKSDARAQQALERARRMEK